MLSQQYKPTNLSITTGFKTTSCFKSDQTDQKSHYQAFYITTMLYIYIKINQFICKCLYLQRSSVYATFSEFLNIIFLQHTIVVSLIFVMLQVEHLNHSTRFCKEYLIDKSAPFIENSELY